MASRSGITITSIAVAASSQKALSLRRTRDVNTEEALLLPVGAERNSARGWMPDDRTWFHHDLYAITIGGGMMNNPGRYLILLPPLKR